MYKKIKHLSAKWLFETKSGTIKTVLFAFEKRTIAKNNGQYKTKEKTIMSIEKSIRKTKLVSPFLFSNIFLQLHSNHGTKIKTTKVSNSSDHWGYSHEVCLCAYPIHKNIKTHSKSKSTLQHGSSASIANNCHPTKQKRWNQQLLEKSTATEKGADSMLGMTKFHFSASNT